MGSLICWRDVFQSHDPCWSPEVADSQHYCARIAVLGNKQAKFQVAIPLKLHNSGRILLNHSTYRYQDSKDNTIPVDPHHFNSQHGSIISYYPLPIHLEGQLAKSSSCSVIFLLDQQLMSSGCLAWSCPSVSLRHPPNQPRSAAPQVNGQSHEL